MNGESGIGRTKMTRHIIVNDVHETGPGTNFRLCIALLRYQVGVSISTSHDTACGGHWMSGGPCDNTGHGEFPLEKTGRHQHQYTMSNMPQITNTNKSREQHKGAGQQAAIISILHISYSVRGSSNKDSASQSRGKKWTHGCTKPSRVSIDEMALQSRLRPDDEPTGMMLNGNCTYTHTEVSWTSRGSAWMTRLGRIVEIGGGCYNR